MNAKNKIYIISFAWVAACALMLGYFFKILDRANENTVFKISEQKKELAVLEAEQESFRQAQQDLAALTEKSYQPSEFFSRDVTLVKEIETLENWGNRLKVNFNLSGLSGTVKGASKAKTQGEVVTVPYAIHLNGPFARVTDFIETMENLDFITHLSTLSISNAGPDAVNANLTANFYLRKQ